MNFMQQGEFPKVKVRREGYSGSIVILSWAMFSILYVWTWRLEVLDTFMAGNSLVNIHSLGDIVRVNRSNQELSLRVVTSSSPEVWHSLVTSPTSAIHPSDYLSVMENTIYVQNFNFGCINETLLHENENDYRICIGGSYDLKVAFNSLLSKNVEEMSSLEFKVLDSQGLYQTFGFPKEFPWMKKVNSRLRRILESGLYSCWDDLYSKTPQVGWDKHQKLLSKFSVQVDVEVMFFVIQAFLSYFVFSIFVFTFEVFQPIFVRLRILMFRRSVIN